MIKFGRGIWFLKLSNMDFFDATQLSLFWPLAFATLLGALVGFEREHIGKSAGVRTNALVCLGAALFTTLSVHFVEKTGLIGSFDPSRIASQVIVGIGFIGAGLILFKEDKIQNLTTAATVWVVAAIGMAVGFGFYLLALLTTVTVFMVLEVIMHLRKFESKLWSNRHDS